VSVVGRIRSVLDSQRTDLIRARWCQLPYLQRQFLANAGIAIVIAIAIAFFHQSHWLVRLENSAIDWMMDVNKSLPRMSSNASDVSLQFTFLDIDDESYAAWGEPYHAPRDKILKLVDFAGSAGAQLIVLDIDLARAGIDPDDDHKLGTYLARYGELASRPPLILVRTFTRGNGDNGQWVNIRPSFLDEFELPATIHWAQPLFKATLWDGVIRHWHLVKFGCLNGQPLLVPATQLLAVALLSDPDSPPRNRFADLNTVRIENCATVNATGTSVTTHDSDAMVSSETELGQRLIYTIPWHEPAPDLITIRANVITESTRELSNDLLRDRIVIIGASFADSRDIHRTPIGEMPGALIIANAIKSFSLYGQLRPPATWALWAQKLALILLVAWAYSRLTSLVAVTVASAIVFATLVPISFYFFKYGISVDFAIPLLAIVIHQAVVDYRNAQISKREAGEQQTTEASQ